MPLQGGIFPINKRNSRSKNQNVITPLIVSKTFNCSCTRKNRVHIYNGRVTERIESCFHVSNKYHPKKLILYFLILKIILLLIQVG